MNIAAAVISGNSAQAYGAKLARVQVVAAYPITPQTTIVERIAQFVAEGELKAEYLKVESEHSALQAAISAAALGARTYTATSSQGLLLMHELLHWASGARAPIVMGVANRAVAPPWSVAADHTDSIAQRDTGWIQLYAESNQEVLDSVLQAFKIAEHPDVRLPVMVCADAFFLSHTVEPVEVPDQAAVDAFLPPSALAPALRPGVRGRLGSYAAPDAYMEFRRKQALAMERAAAIQESVEADFARRFGRHHGGPLPLYRTDDAEAVLVAAGTVVTNARAAVDALRAEGLKVGLAKLRTFRPFPGHKVRALAARVPALGVIDRSFTFGAAGALFTEVAAEAAALPQPPRLASFIAGLGGRDVPPSAVEAMLRALLDGSAPEVSWPGLNTRAEVSASG